MPCLWNGLASRGKDWGAQGASSRALDAMSGGVILPPGSPPDSVDDKRLRPLGSCFPAVEQ